MSRDAIAIGSLRAFMRIKWPLLYDSRGRRLVIGLRQLIGWGKYQVERHGVRRQDSGDTAQIGEHGYDDVHLSKRGASRAEQAQCTTAFRFCLQSES